MKAPATSTFDLASAITGTTYKLHVPNNHPTKGPRVPLVLVMDGDNQLKDGLIAYEELHAAGKIPRLLLVGVGYGSSYESPRNRRMRDYTPTAMKGEAGTGGAEHFRQAIRDEIIPFLTEKLHVQDRDRGITGHSLGSLFGLYAFFHEEPLFTRALLSAPSIWFDDRSILKIEETFAQKHRALAAKLFLAVGAEDSPSMVSDLDILENTLEARPYAGLEITKRRFASRDHYNALPDSFHAGLTALYGK